MQFLPAVQPFGPITEQTWCLAFFEGKLILPEGDSSNLQPLAQPAWASAAETQHYLGQLDGLDCWAVRLAQVPPGWRGVPLRAAMMQMPAALSAVAGRAAQVLEWDRSHRFCGVCGTPTDLHASDRARKCPACGHVAYPRVTPAMMVLVWREGELLLARSPVSSRPANRSKTACTAKWPKRCRCRSPTCATTAARAGRSRTA